jgi:glutaryl-CoA transferase
VMIENFLPEAMREFGLDPTRLRQLNPKLVSCSISAFGRRGPMADRPGYDLMIQAMSGLMSITGETKGAPMKVGVAITDVITGLYAATSVLAGLSDVARGGSGRAFDVALADCTLASLVNVAQSVLVTGERPKRWGNAHPNIVPYEVFQTADGFLALAIGADRQWQKFCQLVERHDWADDPRFGTNPQRVAHRNDLVQLLKPLVAKRSSAVWQEMLTHIDVPHSPVVPLDTALAATQVAGRGMVQEVTDSAGRKFRILGSPIHWVGAEPSTPRSPPALGEHSDEVLREWLAYTNEQIDDLRRAGAIG